MSAVGGRVLLVEDDDGDALLVRELLADAAAAGESFELDRVTTMAEAAAVARRVDCALVDLGLPDATGLSALTELRRLAPDVPVVVLTGLSDRARAIEAMAAGAQDYIIKGQIDGDGLARAIRYAVARREADRDARLLLLSARRQEENDRLARGLLPVLDPLDPVRVWTRYRPGADALLGGDFFDGLVDAQGRVRAVIGDVCGHGPAEAALGVALRIAWRTMVLAGAEAPEVLSVMEQVLLRERDASEPFVTVCDVTIEPAAGRMTVRRHGHPPPLLLRPRLGWIADDPPSPPLGCIVGARAARPITVDLPEHWALVLLTDGLLEGRAGDGRLGDDGLVELIEKAEADADDTGPAAVFDAVIAAAQRLHGGDLDDDVALLGLSARA